MSDHQHKCITRLAPSPTGALHLGNARTFLINWALARQRGWQVVLRIEDLDGPRVKHGADQSAIEDLRWLGLDWDGQPMWQRRDLSSYDQAVHTLRQRGLIYPCICTRREIVFAQSAPHKGSHELRYPGTCRPHVCTASTMDEPARGQDPMGGTKTGGCSPQSIPAHPTGKTLRLLVPDEPISFDDQICGRQCINVQRQVGDFIVATKAALPAYQLAVVIDDVRQAITDIVRGDDLLRSTARQLWLYRLLALSPLPRYWHLPLVLGPDGRRLAKRHGDTRISTYRCGGVAPQRIVALIARWSGLSDVGSDMEVSEFLQRFDIAALPRQPVKFTLEDHVWLLQ